MTPIENTELKGITGRLIYTIIISTAIMVAGGLGAFYGLKFEIVTVRTQNEIRKIELDALKIQVNSIQIQLDRLIDESNKRNAKEANK